MITHEHGKKRLSRLTTVKRSDTLTDSFEHGTEIIETKGRLSNGEKRIITAYVM